MDARDGFNCCGGNDEDPPQHTQDCPRHLPPCYRCRSRQATRTVGIGDAYAQVCDECEKHRKSV